MNIFLFLAGFFLLTYLLGLLFEKIYIPWIFSALIIGVFLSVYNPFIDITSSETFGFLSKLGMYFMLFMIGFEINLPAMLKRSKNIISATFFIIFLEAAFGTLFIYFIFHISLFVAFLVALSFATVGESILIPILEKYKLVNKPLGEYIIGIGTLDDSIEILALVLMTLLIGAQANTGVNLYVTFGALTILFILTFGFRFLGKHGKKFNSPNLESIFLISLFVLFLFIGVSLFADSAPLGALLAGISLKIFMPEKRYKFIESEIKSMSYGFFAPIFYLWIGSTLELNYILSAPLIIIALMVLTNGLKILGSYIIGRKKLGLKNSFIMGIGLSARFSTSIILVKILYENNIIQQDLYSIIVASSVLFTIIIPLLFSFLIAKVPISTQPSK